MNEQISFETQWLPYLIELRRRILWSFASVFIMFCGLFPFAQTLYSYLALPLVKQLPSGQGLIAIGITSPLLIPLKFIAILSVFFAIPIWLYHLWMFCYPALYKTERRWFWAVLGTSIGLFYGGILFAYSGILPLIFKFLLTAAPNNVKIMPDIAQYLGFVLQMFLGFGLAFEVPLVVIVLILSQLVPVDNFVNKRPYIIVGAFILGMIFAPPDVISQVLLAVPLWLLYEIGIMVAKCLIRLKK